LEFDPAAFEDLAWWIEQNRKKAMQIIKLIREVQRDPYAGLGKPERLKHELAGCWSRPPIHSPEILPRRRNWLRKFRSMP